MSDTTPIKLGSEFDEDYFLRGPETGKSNFSNYRWRPELTIPVCKLMVKYLGVETRREKPQRVENSDGYRFVGEPDKILDYGAGRGYYVKALRGLGFDAYGFDISEWAIANCDTTVEKYVSTDLQKLPKVFDFILCKDVLEHIPEAYLDSVLQSFLEMTLRAALIIVPLAVEDTGLYVSPIDQSDSTHKIAWTLTQWILHIQSVIDASGRAFTVNGGYKLPGVKTAADPYPQSCGFLTIRRFEYE